MDGDDESVELGRYRTALLAYLASDRVVQPRRLKVSKDGRS